MKAKQYNGQICRIRLAWFTRWTSTTVLGYNHVQYEIRHGWLRTGRLISLRILDPRHISVTLYGAVLYQTGLLRVICCGCTHTNSLCGLMYGTVNLLPLSHLTHFQDAYTWPAFRLSQASQSKYVILQS